MSPTAMPMSMGMMPPMTMGGGMMPMGMMPMGMGMMPMMGMGMGMPMGMGMGPLMGMGPMMGMMQMAAMAGGEGGGAKSSSAPASGPLALRLGGEPSHSPEDIAFALESIEEGEYIEVAYTHPRIGKTRYRGVLSEKYVGESNLQSYIQLNECQRIGSRGHLREREASKRLMTAFIDEVQVASPAAAAARGHDPSRSRSPRPSAEELGGGGGGRSYHSRKDTARP